MDDILGTHRVDAIIKGWERGSDDRWRGVVEYLNGTEIVNETKDQSEYEPIQRAHSSSRAEAVSCDHAQTAVSRSPQGPATLNA